MGLLNMLSFKKTFGGDDADKRNDGVSVGGFNLNNIGKMKTAIDAKKNGKEDFNLEMFSKEFWGPFSQQRGITTSGDEISEFSRVYYLELPDVMTTAEYVEMLKSDEELVNRIMGYIAYKRHKEEVEQRQQRAA